MRLTCVSDLHGLKPTLKRGDLLIVAGDLTARDEPSQHLQFLDWLEAQPYKHKVFIAGNHDGFIQKNEKLYKETLFEFGIHYLQDSSCVIEGLKIYGMPWTIPFMAWHFMAFEELMKEKVSAIPDDIDILITHGPPKGTLDFCAYRDLGCPILANKIWRLENLKLHVFGHIHSGYGQKTHAYGQNIGLHSVNCALMTNGYEPDNEPTYITLQGKKMDKQINKIKKSLDKGEKETKTLLKMDKVQDKKVAELAKLKKKKKK